MQNAMENSRRHRVLLPMILKDKGYEIHSTFRRSAELDGPVILLRWAWRAASLGDVAFQEFGQSVDDFRVLRLQIPAFAGVVGQVEELDRGKAFRRGASGARGTPAPRVGADGQLPRSLADGERAI